jgi:hypothetical protein
VSGTWLVFDYDEGDATAVEYLADFLLVWAGDMQEALTAAWLTVPMLGKHPFMAHELLWWDDTPGSRGRRHIAADRPRRSSSR